MTEKDDGRDMVPVHNRLPKKLSHSERIKLPALERYIDTQIEKGIKADLEIGRTLKIIARQRLWRETKYASFGEYVRGRFKFTPSRGRQLVYYGDVVDDLDGMPLPRSENSVRVLVPLPKDMRRLTYQKALEMDPEPSEGVVRQALSEVIGQDEPHGEPETIIEEEESAGEAQQRETQPEPPPVRRDVYGRTVPESAPPVVEPEIPTLRSLCDALEDRIERVLDFLPRESGTPDPDLGEALVQLDTIIHQLVPQLRHQAHVENHVAH